MRYETLLFITITALFIRGSELMHHCGGHHGHYGYQHCSGCRSWHDGCSHGASGYCQGYPTKEIPIPEELPANEDCAQRTTNADAGMAHSMRNIENLVSLLIDKVSALEKKAEDKK
ncbi:hypothetical protein ACHAW6_007948 [Cyclotella cf. meneghiniana]